MNANELINFVNSVGKDKAKYIEEYDAYALKIDNLIGVAIDCSDTLIINPDFCVLTENLVY